MILPLRTPAEFRELRATGRRTSAGPLTMIVSADSDPERTRVAYAIGRPVGNAVCRNRLRRRLRPIMRALDATAELPASSYLVICRPAARDLDHLELTSCLHDALQHVSAP